MKKRHKKMLCDLNKIATHFKLKLAKVEVMKTMAFAVDNSNKKFIFIYDRKQPSFKTIDLQNVDSCSVKFEYTGLEASELNKTNTYNSIKQVQLPISHSDPSKSLNIVFYDIMEDKISDVRQWISKARSWRDTITAQLPICL